MTQNPSIKSKALQFAYQRYIGEDPQQRRTYDEALLHAEIARQLYDLRTAANLTQQQLAGLVGTTPSVICRLEDADYLGHSLTMLHRIATALGQRVDVRFLPAHETRQTG
jgi:DNA-binding XRE family transcriptional regulator